LNTPATILSCTWSFGDPSSGSANTSTATNPSHVFSAPGSYTVTVSVVASCGTFTTSFTSVITECLPPCQATIIADDGCSGRNIPFRISSNSTITSLTWNFGDPAGGANNTSVLSAAGHTYNNSGSYLVTANVVMSCGSVTASKTIAIVSCEEELAGCATILPTGFTPNGDGQNDVFLIRSEDLKTVNVFRVYNRWGQLIFEKKNVLPNDATSGWDGSFQGQYCAPDIYMYYVEGTCLSGKNTTLKGDVMIIR
jgi:gliding motility-associated-like protein